MFCKRGTQFQILYLYFLIAVCCGNEWNLEIVRKRKTGELRKACSKHGNAIQPNARVNTTERLMQIRKLMQNETVTKGIRINAYIVPSQDEHQTEFVSEYDKRQDYISGFSGSAGDVVITTTKAILWTDGRYHLQADDQLDCNWLLMRESFAQVPTLPEWLQNEFPNGSVVGVDPKFIAQAKWKAWEQEMIQTNITLVAIEANLVDLLWKVANGRYPKRSKDAFVLEDRYSGRHWTSKVGELRTELAKIKADAMIVTSLDEIAWLLNIRGRDIPFSPFVRSYVLVDYSGLRLYVNESQLMHFDVMSDLNGGHNHTNQTVRIYPYETVCGDLTTLSQVYRRILVPGASVYSLGASRFIYNCVPSENVLEMESPIMAMKAQKNAIESRGMYVAHIRDAAAMCEFFSYFETRFKSGTNFSELEIVKILNEFRFEQRNSLGNSFRTIAGYGANGAQPHYEPTPNTNINIFNNSTLVLDSGGQYYDGTTDVTRTLHMGEPTQEQKEAYTRVLMGQIALSTLVFPENLHSAAADVLARAPLWEVGLDYFHGTSHGIGSFLNVHESPIYLSFDDPRPRKAQELKPQYFLSNEPGYYKEGDFGIRLENVMEVVEKTQFRHKSGQAFLGFKTVTLVPYEPKLFDLSLLSVQHRRWLNAYNERIRIQVGAELKKQNFMNGFYWMMEKTENIPEYGGSHMVRGHFKLMLFVVSVVFLVI